MIALIEQVLLSGAVILLISSPLFSLLYPVYRRTLISTSIENTSGFTFIYAALGLIISLVSTCLLLFPTLSAPLIFDHCHQGTCSPHTPEAIFSSFAGFALVSTVTVAIFIVAGLMVKSIRRAGKKLAILNRLASKGSRIDGGPDYQVVESKDVFAWCAGLTNPRIFVSRGMLNQTSHEQLELVLAHEYCHLENRDNLRKFLVNWLTVFWLPRQKRLIRQDFARWVEQYSDLYASRKVGITGMVSYRANGAIVVSWKSDVLQLALLTIQFIFAVTIMTSLSHFMIELMK